MNTIDKTLGETAYDAYYTDCASIPFAAMSTACRAAWEAAAQAVLSRTANMGVRAALEQIVEMNNGDDPDCYAADDPHNCLIVIGDIARAALEAADAALAKVKQEAR